MNLGIKVPPEQLIAAVRPHKPDIPGLSGLLVKSAQQMVITAADLTAAGASLPILVGGASRTVLAAGASWGVPFWSADGRKLGAFV